MWSKLPDDIKYIGVDRPDHRIFEAQYPIPHGMSYNSYIILDEKIAVMDSVEADGGEQWLADIIHATGGAAPDYLVVHHMEPDHSASIALAMERFPAITLVTSGAAAKMLPQFFPDADFSGRILTVANGSTLPLGSRELTFLAAPMVHWPEVTVSFEKTSGILFSADAFGKFGSLQYHDDWVNEGRRYYINIVGRYGKQVQQLLKKTASLPIKAIAPLHGPMLTEPLDQYVELYHRWSTYAPEETGILIAYASIYGGTRQAALLLADELKNQGVDTVVAMEITPGSMSEAVAQAFRLSHMVVASPTYDTGLFPPVHDFFHHLSMKGFCNRKVAFVENGSWAPTAAARMASLTATMGGVEEIAPKVTVRSRLNDESREAIRELAHTLSCSILHESY